VASCEKFEQKNQTSKNNLKCRAPLIEGKKKKAGAARSGLKKRWKKKKLSQTKRPSGYPRLALLEKKFTQDGQNGARANKMDVTQNWRP